MPIFEYRCTECGEKFEKMVKNSNVTLICKKCGSDKLKKLFSTFSANIAEPSSSCSLGESSSTCCPSGSCGIN
ncbi:MAG: zinc ribbon domain-containing protein [Verrucomicrobiota bacterium]|nr:zinc ribbon domain-containing protein [Verrucomicrobiota bacterium]